MKGVKMDMAKAVELFQKLEERHICAEIQYEKPVGYVHSDICFNTDMSESEAEEYRKFLHDALDEWLNQDYGAVGATKHTGYFVVGAVQLTKDILEEYDIPFQE